MSEPFGLLNILKPPDMSSHDVVSAVRRAVGTRRVGHGGTLDPAAAGVMAVAVGKATRLLGYLHDQKAYRAEVVFGLATASVDAEGDVIATADARQLTREALEAALSPFRGLITQRPPMTSAVHVQGKRLYEFARAGVTLPDADIPTREVTIHHLALVDFVPGPRAKAYMDITCSAGTYIRSLAVDIAASLDLPACLGFLLRTQAGDCQLAQAQTLEELVSAGPRWLPEEAWLGHLPLQVLDEAGLEEIGHGRRVLALASYGADATVRLHDVQGRLTALAQPRGPQLQPVLVF